jgi:hypothetical protein
MATTSVETRLVSSQQLSRISMVLSAWSSEQAIAPIFKVKEAQQDP